VGAQIMKLYDNTLKYTVYTGKEIFSCTFFGFVSFMETIKQPWSFQADVIHVHKNANLDKFYHRLIILSGSRLNLPISVG
jgi:hypothetical protein